MLNSHGNLWNNLLVWMYLCSVLVSGYITNVHEQHIRDRGPVKHMQSVFFGICKEVDVHKMIIPIIAVSCCCWIQGFIGMCKFIPCCQWCGAESSVPFSFISSWLHKATNVYFPWTLLKIVIWLHFKSKNWRMWGFQIKAYIPIIFWFLFILDYVSKILSIYTWCLALN